MTCLGQVREGEPVASRTGGTLSVSALGRISVDRDGDAVDLQAGQRQLLALLIAAGPQGASADRLADEIWAEELPRQWQNSIRVAVSRLRKRTGLMVPSIGGVYRLDIDRAAVDLWQLFQMVDECDEWNAEMAPLLATPEVFPSIEISPMLQQTAARVSIAQQHLIELLSMRGGNSSRKLLGELVGHLGDDASDDRLVHAVATIHANSGASATALGLIERCRRDRREVLGADLSPGLVSLERSIRESSVVIEAEEPPFAPRPLPAELVRYRAEGLVGRDAELDGLLNSVSAMGRPKAIVIRGLAGAGKTALLAELAHSVGPDIHVVYIAGTEGGRIALGPLTSAVKGFADQVDAVDKLQLDSIGRMGLLATRLMNLIADKAAGKRLLLLVDDAHWLDGPTCELISFLARSGDSNNLATLVIAARSERRRSAWADLERSLSRTMDGSELALVPLEVADVTRLVAAAHPNLTFTARHQLAINIEKASAGLPEVALRLLEIGLDRSSDGGGTLDVFDRLVDGLEEQIAETAVGAAVIGRVFRIAELVELLGVAEETLMDAIDSLIRQNLVLETGSLDRFEFSHQLIVDALLRSVSQSKRTRLHLKACSLTTDIHDLSRHQVASGSLIDTETKLQTVVESARTHLRNRKFWESASEFRTAIAIDGTGLPPEVYVDFATALSISGARGASLAVRERAYEKAVTLQRWDLVLHAACSGLPEAEVPDGEEDRLESLRLIPTEQLTPSQKLLQALTAARLAAQLGLLDEARQWVDRASKAAETDEDRCEAALCERFVRTVDLSPAERIRRLDKALEPLSAPLSMQCRRSFFRSVDQLELGKINQAIAEHQLAEAAAIELNDPLRQWQTLILSSLIQETKGQVHRADELADEAQRLGHRFGIAQAEVARIAQMSSRLAALGQLGSLANSVRHIPVSDSSSMLFGAGMVRLLAATGEKDLAAAQAADLTRQVLDKPSATSHGVIGLVAASLGHHPDRNLRQRARLALEPFEGGAMVLGVGLGLLPSVTYLSSLLEDSSESGQERALEACIGACDESGFVIWSIRYRMELGEMTGSMHLIREAHALAETTDLAGQLASANLVA